LAVPSNGKLINASVFMTAFVTINAYQGLLYEGFMTAFVTINAYQGLLYDGF